MIPETLTDLIGIWVAAFLTLCVFSFLFKDNVFFKLMEALFVGVSVGYGIVLTWHAGLLPKVVEPFLDFAAHLRDKTALDWIWASYMLVSIAIGMLFLPRLLGERYAWQSRIPMAYSIGLGTGMGMPLAVQTYIFAQMNATLIPVVAFTAGHGVDWRASVGNCALIVGVLSVLYYFFFSFRKTDPVSRTLSKVGIAYLMLGFGASFAMTVMARITLLIGRIGFLKEDWIMGSLRYFGIGQ